MEVHGSITRMVNLPIEYSDKPVTPFGGMALMKRFVDQTGIREHLATVDLPRGGSNCAYDPVHVIECFWMGIWTGASRYIHCDWLRQDETLAAIFGYEAPAEPKHLQPVLRALLPSAQHSRVPGLAALVL